MTAFVPTEGMAATCMAPFTTSALPSRLTIEYSVEPVGPLLDCTDAATFVTTAGSGSGTSAGATTGSVSPPTSWNTTDRPGAVARADDGALDAD